MHSGRREFGRMEGKEERKKSEQVEGVLFFRDINYLPDLGKTQNIGSASGSRSELACT